MMLVSVFLYPTRYKNESSFTRCTELCVMRKSKSMHVSYLNSRAYEKHFTRDYDLSRQCTEFCLENHNTCIGNCSTETLCLFSCDSELTGCLMSCPCQVDCPFGCQECPNQFCKCHNFETKPEYLECEVRVLTYSITIS